jgi:hypothetical protein
VCRTQIQAFTLRVGRNPRLFLLGREAIAGIIEVLCEKEKTTDKFVRIGSVPSTFWKARACI